MPLLLLNDRHAIGRKNELRKRIAATEVCQAPKQTSNDEGRPQNLQMGAKENRSVTAIEPEVRFANKPSGRCSHSGQSRID